MTKNKFYIFLIVGLLISNLLLIGFLVFRRPPHPPMEGPKTFIIERLHFDNAQTVRFSKLVEQHRANSRALNLKIEKAKGELYQTLSTTDANPEHYKNIFAKIAALEAEIELLHYNHFLDIKNLCKPNQLEYYKELTEQMAHFFVQKPPMKR